MNTARFQRDIAKIYFGEEVDIRDDGVDKLAEEIFAYITGLIHAGDPSGEVHTFLRDYDAVKAAWDVLVEKQTKGQSPIQTEVNPGNSTDANPSVGAADQNFTGRAVYQDLLTDENSQRDRSGDVRPVEVPKVDGYGRRVSEFVGNAYGAEVVPDKFVPRIEEMIQEHKSRVIDTDDFREYIPEYNGSNAAVVHEEASEIRDRVFEAATANGDNILLSTIGANAEKLADNIKTYKELGYNMYLHLNELPNNKSLARSIGRYIAEDGTLGRYVSPKLIAEYGDKPTQTYLYLTGQGGKENGRLGGYLRESRGSAYSNVEKTGEQRKAQQIQQVSSRDTTGTTTTSKKEKPQN